MVRATHICNQNILVINLLSCILLLCLQFMDELLSNIYITYLTSPTEPNGCEWNRLGIIYEKKTGPIQ